MPVTALDFHHVQHLPSSWAPPGTVTPPAPRAACASPSASFFCKSWGQCILLFRVLSVLFWLGFGGGVCFFFCFFWGVGVFLSTLFFLPGFHSNEHLFIYLLLSCASWQVTYSHTGKHLYLYFLGGRQKVSGLKLASLQGVEERRFWECFHFVHYPLEIEEQEELPNE